MSTELFARTLHRPFAAGVLLLTCALAGCDRGDPEFRATPPRTADISETLADGDEALREMQDAALHRDYSRYFDSYEELRRCYIAVSRALGTDHADSEAEDLLDRLSEWEGMIEAARRAWQHTGALSEQASVEAPGEFQDQEMSKKAHEYWKKRNEAWAPFESQLDEAMKRTRVLRDKPGNGS